MVWQRLEDCYGSPEVIENALLKKIEDFQKITNKDNKKLRELGNMLLELEVAKPVDTCQASHIWTHLAESIQS